MGTSVSRDPLFTMYLALIFSAALSAALAEGPLEVDLDAASSVISAALRKSQEMGVKMNIAVVDAGADLVGFIRMDDAWLGSVDIAIKKAKTSVMFNMESGVIGTLSQPGGSLYNIEHSNDGLISFPGGVPIRNSNGELIGAVGVSGSTVEDDHDVAAA